MIGDSRAQQRPASGQEGERDVVPFPKPLFEVDLEKDVCIPMRDEVGLYADIYRPRGARHRLATILIRTQYNKAPYRERDSKTCEGVAYQFASQGFTVVVQDIRGRFRSEGVFHPAASDADDGYHTVAWVAAQPWSNGKVGGYGCSALGINQVMMAPRRPPALAAILPQASGGAMRNRPFGIISSGVPEFGWAFEWFRDLGNQRSQVPPAIEYLDFLQTLPLADMNERSGGFPNDWRDWITHELGDLWWRQFAFFDENSRPDVPGLFIESWYDNSVNEGIDLFNAFKNQSMTERSRRNQYLIISPTQHCQSEWAQSPYLAGERDLGDVRQDYWSIYLRWFDHWLRRDGKGEFNMPHVQYYLMGANRWKFADTWPLPGTRFTPYYFSSGGHANTNIGDGKLSTAMASGPADHYRYDPADPTPSPEAIHTRGDGSAADQREVDLRPDRLVYTTEPLRLGVEVTGPLRAVLYVSSSAVDTDFVVTLSDVYPDGRVYNLQKGVARARYRNAYTAQPRYREDYSGPSLLTPGKIYRIEVNMEATGNWFGPDHRIRVQVASSSFPHFARNLNTAGNSGTETAAVVAQNTLYHDNDHPSNIMLPVVP
ncbi:CocE/NonD family hydrolase [Mesorhizobium sp.]|uniref:CocE/NonD family hydrolase n=1 Tax=Mesorhizobium sp. TaxID=1871066 RepID=UPI00122864D4|nr:CocE/NonD family hydrolase [Mesorhizobium sp.]TIL34590.1 MAG: CocE/NonD family hydrolase [Mesorhizobium sp.]TIM48590.1 MAG: CocE/NonD family hydrolase [Mesorhizobium sp.]